MGSKLDQNVPIKDAELDQLIKDMLRDEYTGHTR